MKFRFGKADFIAINRQFVRQSKEVATAKMNGNGSHGRSLDSLPKNVKEKLVNSDTYKKQAAKQKKLEKTRSDAQKINWANPLQVAKTIPVIVAAVGVSLYMTAKGWKQFIFA